MKCKISESGPNIPNILNIGRIRIKGETYRDNWTGICTSRQFQQIFSRLNSYLIFVRNARNAVSVKFLAECKKIREKRENYSFGLICRKFTHFPSVKFPGLKMCECKKMTNIRYARKCKRAASDSSCNLFHTEPSITQNILR